MTVLSPMKLYEYARKQHPACLTVKHCDSRSNPCLHCHLLIHEALSVHILWLNFTCKSMAGYATWPVWLVYISPSSSCPGDLCETAFSIRGPTETLHCNQCRHLQGPTDLDCPDLPHQGPSFVHMGLGASGPWLSHVLFSEIQLFPVLLLAVPSLSVGFSRLTSGLTC